MKPLNVFCEGPTEQGFCAQVLQPHLFPRGEGLVHTLAAGFKSDRHVHGVGRPNKYIKLRRFILNTIKQRGGQDVYFTTLFDLYGLPIDFPGKDAHVRNPANPAAFSLDLEEAFGADIGNFRFIPHLQLHEYETILFAHPEAFAYSFEDCAAEVEQLKAIAASEPGIEHINDGRETAPSKRIISIFPEYAGRKASAGPDIAEYIGIPKIRDRCPHFHRWLARLETLLWGEERVSQSDEGHPLP